MKEMCDSYKDAEFNYDEEGIAAEDILRDQVEIGGFGPVLDDLTNSVADLLAFEKLIFEAVMNDPKMSEELIIRAKKAYQEEIEKVIEIKRG